jgi:hypothetical protein
LYGLVNVPGSYQSQVVAMAIGCLIARDCDAMKKGDDGKWHSGPFELKAGDYEVKSL